MVEITYEKVAKYMKKYYAKDYDTPRKFENAVKRKYDAFMRLYNTPLVKEIVVKMEWKKNSMWGWNPYGTAYVRYVNGDLKVFKDKTRVSSCGYAKDSALLESFLNDVARQNLYHKRLSAYKNHPDAGFSVDSTGLSRYYSLGGTEGKYSFFTIKKVAFADTYSEFVIKFR